MLSGYVAAIGLRIPALRQDFGADPLGCLFVYIQQPDAGSAAGKPLGDRAPDAAARSCYYGEFASKGPPVRIEAAQIYLTCSSGVRSRTAKAFCASVSLGANCRAVCNSFFASPIFPVRP
jgi:hypothetical protein